MKATVIYHSGDYDGIFCREIARRFLGDEGVQYIGWNYGDAQVHMPETGTVYVLDLNPECLCCCENYERVVWIDHHKTAIEHWPDSIPGYRIEGVAACRLAYQWFVYTSARESDIDMELPAKEAFVARAVVEPLAVQLAGEYDIWDRRDHRAQTFQYGLRVAAQTPNLWQDLLKLETAGGRLTQFIVDQGLVAQTYARSVDADIVRHRSFKLSWQGMIFLALNTARCNSLTFAALDVPETGHDALLGFYHDGNKWTVSLYHAGHRTELDLSEIAKKFGGGGHRGACGFTCRMLPWQL